MKYLFFLLTLHCAVFALEANNIEHLRLVWIEKPQTEATIIWDSTEPTKVDNVVIWGADKEKITFTGIESKAYTDKKEKYYFRHVKLTGLSPDTTYQMTATSDGETSRVFNFRTAPADNQPFKLLYVGDSRTRPEVAHIISEQMANMVDKDPEVLAAIHGGDYANKPQLSDWKPWLDAWDKTTNPKSGRLLPIIPVVGNHEEMKRSPLFGEAYGYPGGKDRYLYSCELAPMVRIVVLNSEIPSTGEQEDFLVTTLKGYQQNKILWQIAAFHRPVYPAVKKPSALKRLVPIFEEYQLDLVLESDGHCIKRTVPIRAEKQHPDGVVYLGEGGFGAPQRKTKELWYLEEPGFAGSADHLMVLRFSEKAIDYQTIDPEGKVLDQWQFLPKKR